MLLFIINLLNQKQNELEGVSTCLEIKRPLTKVLVEVQVLVECPSLRHCATKIQAFQLR